IALLEKIYIQDPSYRDVGQRLQEALLTYGDELALAKEWCAAEAQYTAAIAISVTPGSIARRDEFRSQCQAIAQLTGQEARTPRPMLMPPTPDQTAALGTPTPGLSDLAVTTGETLVAVGTMSTTAATT